MEARGMGLTARRAAEEKRKEEAAARATSTRKREEEAAERRKVATAAAASRNRTGPPPSEASTSAHGVEVEIPRMINKGKGRSRVEVTGGDPDDGDDKDDDEEEEKVPSVKREGGPSGERMAVMESQLAQALADLRALPETHSRSQQYLRQLLRRQDKDHGKLIAIETRLAMAGPATPGPSRTVSEKPRSSKRRRIVENSDKDKENEEEEEVEKEGEGAQEEGEDKTPALKKARMATSEKGKEREVV
ncbi:hypothetical protein F5876DRAFT_81438 [Lentinula aff. lateritia]|uniref:Uncharacterized protein n=1 Tax=Lentinula aff. lateritia TaxID=2804960 RepID=A0ACC1TLZ8_9AGAR|nr:hypothetical protein F5876DRAFT_81438 [Lentinula aff. lateritia]